MVGKLNMPPVKGYLGTFEAVRKAGDPIPQLDVATIGSLIQDEFGKLPETLQFSGTEKLESALDDIVAIGTDNKDRKSVWATPLTPSGYASAAVFHGYLEHFLSQTPVSTSSHVVVVIAYKATELVKVSGEGMYKFRTSPKAAFVALRYFHVKYGSTA